MSSKDTIPLTSPTLTLTLTLDRIWQTLTLTLSLQINIDATNGQADIDLRGLRGK